MWNTIVNAVAEHGVLTWILGVSASCIVARAWAGDKVRRALVAVRSMVAVVEQTYVKELKAARTADSPGAGRLTPDEQKTAHKRALDALLAQLSSTGLAAALWILGWGQRPGDWLGDQIEVEVANRALLGK